MARKRRIRKKQFFGRTSRPFGKSKRKAGSEFRGDTEFGSADYNYFNDTF